VPEIVKPESLQASCTRERAPGRAPRLLRATGVNVHVLAGRKNVGLRVADSKRAGPVKEKAEAEHGIRVQRSGACLLHSCRQESSPLPRTDQRLTAKAPQIGPPRHRAGGYQRRSVSSCPAGVGLGNLKESSLLFRFEDPCYGFVIFLRESLYVISDSSPDLSKLQHSPGCPKDEVVIGVLQPTVFHLALQLLDVGCGDPVAGKMPKEFRRAYQEESLFLEAAGAQTEGGLSL
jgi:hypothetical protein